MISLLLRNLPSVAAVMAALLAGWLAYSWAYDRGYAARDADLVEDTARKQARIDVLTGALAVHERALAVAAIARTDLERRLADEAAQDPLGRDPGLGANSLLRLNQIR